MREKCLERLELSGFASIKEMDLRFGPINVLIGGNAAGKSNLVFFLKMLGFMINGNLQLLVARAGGANSLFYYGGKRTPQIDARLTFTNGGSRDVYHMALSSAADDTLVFADETVSHYEEGHPGARTITLGAGHKETKLSEAAQEDDTARAVRDVLRRCKRFQFHDTSAGAKIRGKCKIEQNQHLYGDGANLAAYLYLLKQTEEQYYQRIVETIRQVAPQFGDFYLSPERANEELISLNWQEPGNDYVFGPHQLSDGLLRFMALSTLLLQPEGELPSLLIIDEPELGLHPYAIRILAGLVRKAIEQCQIILATQSPSIVDEFDPEDIITVDREGLPAPSATTQMEWRSVFRRLDAEALEEWLQDYSLSELWHKSVIGGRPSR